MQEVRVLETAAAQDDEAVLVHGTVDVSAEAPRIDWANAREDLDRERGGHKASRTLWSAFPRRSPILPKEGIVAFDVTHAWDSRG